MTNYIDDMGKLVVVSSGISDGKAFMACRVKKSGALQRIKSKFLPIRNKRREAQADLDAYAAQMCWETEIKNQKS